MKFIPTPPTVPPSASAYTIIAKPKGGQCINCNSFMHFRKNCDKPKSNCDYCGSGAGHMTEYCFVTTTGELPNYLNADRKAEIEVLREEYQKKKTNENPNKMLAIKDKTMFNIVKDKALDDDEAPDFMNKWGASGGIWGIG